MIVKSFTHDTPGLRREPSGLQLDFVRVVNWVKKNQQAEYWVFVGIVKGY